MAETLNLIFVLFIQLLPLIFKDIYSCFLKSYSYYIIVLFVIRGGLISAMQRYLYRFKKIML